MNRVRPVMWVMWKKKQMLLNIKRFLLDLSVTFLSRTLERSVRRTPKGAVVLCVHPPEWRVEKKGLMNMRDRKEVMNAKIPESEGN